VGDARLSDTFSTTDHRPPCCIASGSLALDINDFAIAADHDAHIVAISVDSDYDPPAPTFPNPLDATHALVSGDADRLLFRDAIFFFPINRAWPSLRHEFWRTQAKAVRTEINGLG
jgi:hypothetical protein